MNQALYAHMNNKRKMKKKNQKTKRNKATDTFNNLSDESKKKFLENAN
jgi:hypothetical protein